MVLLTGVNWRGWVWIWFEHQQVPRLALQILTNRLQGVEAHTLDLALLEHGQVGFGDADVFGQVFGLGLAFGQYDVEFDNDGHGAGRSV